MFGAGVLSIRRDQRRRTDPVLLDAGAQATTRPVPSVLDALEEIDDLDLERLRDEVQARERDIHLAALERADLGAVKAALVGEHVLGPAALAAKLSNPLTQ